MTTNATGLISAIINGGSIAGVPAGANGGIYLNGPGTQPSISNMTISGGKSSLYSVNGAGGTLSNNTFIGASVAGIYYGGSATYLASTSVDATNIVSAAPAVAEVSGQALPAGFSASASAVADPYSALVSGLFYQPTAFGADPLGTGSSHWLQTGNITIASGAVMDIYAGTVMKRQAGTLTVNGTLNIRGKVVLPVTMTSVNDNSVGGASGSGSPVAGEGFGISYQPGSSGFVDYLNDPYALSLSIQGAPINLTGLSMLHASGGPSLINPGAITLTDLNVDVDGAGSALTIRGATAPTSTVTFAGKHFLRKKQSNAPVVAMDGAFLAANISNCTIDGGQYGVNIYNGSSLTLSSCVVRNSPNIGIRIGTNLAGQEAGVVSIIDSAIVNNGQQGIYVGGAPAGSLIQGNLIRGNGYGTSFLQGVGIWVDKLATTDVDIRNNLIVENVFSGQLNGGAVFIGGDVTGTGPTVRLIGNTIADNQNTVAGGEAGLVVDTYANVTIAENILAQNLDLSLLERDALIDPTALVSEAYNLTADQSIWDGGATDIYASPIFHKSWYLSDTRLGQGQLSPAIDVYAAAAPAWWDPYATTASDGLIDGSLGDNLDLGYHHKAKLPSANGFNITKTVLTAGPGGQTSLVFEPVQTTTPAGPGLLASAAIVVNSAGGGESIALVRDLGDGKYEVIVNHGNATGQSCGVQFTVQTSVPATSAIQTVTW